MPGGNPFEPHLVLGQPLFACHLDGCEPHNRALVDEVERQRGMDPRGEGRSVRLGWHSGATFRACRHESLGWVLQRCFAFATQALAPRYDGWRTQTLKLRSFWSNVLDEGGAHDLHHHLPRDWSGVYYVEVGEIGEDPDRAGWLEFADSDAPAGAPSPGHPPRDGELLLFPSGLTHRVTPVRKRRVTVAFNFDVAPRFGE